MKLTIEPTEQFFMAGDVTVRAWRGSDADGREVIALVAAVSFSGALEVPGLVSIPPPDFNAARGWAADILSRVTPTEGERHGE